jgi:hypothetical protein
MVKRFLIIRSHINLLRWIRSYPKSVVQLLVHLSILLWEGVRLTKVHMLLLLRILQWLDVIDLFAYIWQGIHMSIILILLIHVIRVKHVGIGFCPALIRVMFVKRYGLNAIMINVIHAHRHRIRCAVCLLFPRNPLYYWNSV